MTVSAACMWCRCGARRSDPRLRPSGLQDPGTRKEHSSRRERQGCRGLRVLAEQDRHPSFGEHPVGHNILFPRRSGRLGGL